MRNPIVPTGGQEAEPGRPLAATGQLTWPTQQENNQETLSQKRWKVKTDT